MTPYKTQILETEEGARRLRKYPPDVQICVLRQVQRLAFNPTKLSRRAPSPPYRLGEAQIYPFRCRDTTPPYYVVAFFRYSQDEKTILVEAFTLASSG